MKRKSIFLGTLFLLGIVFVCIMVYVNNNPINNNVDKSVVQTPVRVGKGESKASLDNWYSLKEAVYNSDIVVDITITSWLGEDKDQLLETYFSADVNDSLKGDSPKKIVLLQSGNSDSTIKNYPLFKIGDRMIVFLKKAVEIDYEDAYYLIASYTSIMDVNILDDKLYVADRIGVLTEGILDRKSTNKSFNFTAIDATTQSELRHQLYSYDPLLPKGEDFYRNVFLYNEMVKTLESISLEGGN